MDFRKKITSYTPEVDTEVWQQMESLLDQGSVTAPLNGKRAAPNYWLWIGMGIVALLIMGVVLRSSWTNNEIHSEATKSGVETENTTEQKEVQSTVAETNHATTIDSERLASANASDNNEDNFIDHSGQTRSVRNTNTTTASNDKALHSKGNVNKISALQDSGTTNSINANPEDIFSINTKNKFLPIDTERNEQKRPEAKPKYGENFVSKNAPSLSSKEEGRGAFLNAERDSRTFALQKIMGKEFKLKYDRPLIETGEIQFTKPMKTPSKYTLAIEIGQAQTLRYQLGAQFSVHGMYDINSFLSTGLRMGFSRITEPGNFTIDPEVRSYERDVTFHWYTAITPIRIWKISLGLEGGYGYTWSSVNQRTAESTGAGSRYVYNSYISEGMWFMLGAKADVNVSENMKIGLFYGGNAATETTMNGVRLIWRL